VADRWEIDVPGEFVKPNARTIGEAASTMESKMAQGFRISLTNPPGKESYPIASFTWLLVPTNPPDKTKGKMVKDMVLWALDNGEGMASGLSYAPLPKEVVDKAKAAINQQVK
jgi:phosphate transport system substrate-binding protein